MEKIRPFWRIVIGLLILGICVYYTNMLTFGNNWFAFAFWWALLAAYIFLAVKIKYDDPLRAMRDIMQKQMDEQPGGDRESPAQVDRKPEPVRPALDDRHGRFVTNLVGVTFDNEDGTSRQRILKDYYISGVKGSELSLEEYEYRGKPAVRVLLDDQCVGNIPKTRVGELLPIMDRLESVAIDIEAFTPDYDEDDTEERRRRGSKIYRADLFLIYTK